MTTAEAELVAMLDTAEAAIRDAQAFEHEHGLASRHTRKLPADTLRIIRRWRTAASGDTLTPVVADGTAAKRAASADKQVNVVCTEEPQVPVAPSTSVRIPESLRERVEEYGREHRWSMGEVTRVALEQLVGDEQHGDQPTRPEEH